MRESFGQIAVPFWHHSYHVEVSPPQPLGVPRGAPAPRVATLWRLLELRGPGGGRAGSGAQAGGRGGLVGGEASLAAD